ncbi:MAG TPA: type II toxin-antitoxin system VapC family toxin [Sphingomicrobium sp.]|jgi:PIN domain nuclease of toxin-antitoxin system|nr:type II toxin-antitoxin system VapC family toxin [Sphingomicrobium sp.]
MRILLDTHALLWWLSDDPALGRKARDHIADPENAVLVSSASLWEIVIKQRLGKLQADIAEIESEVARQGMIRLDLRPVHLIELSAMTVHHRDPFDQMLVAQARSEDMPLVTSDAQIAAYSVDRIAADR